ncbi:MAG TPA: hypothetical protein VMM36_12595 [Opitutaceae bacterium]|nr:hypothetical protein [Opitutaceae bacterium]
MNARSILAASCIASTACLCGATGGNKRPTAEAVLAATHFNIVDAQAKAAAGGETFASGAQLPVGRFTIVDAQAMADARRNGLYGACGRCVFKEKRGSVWIFKTTVGYGGRHVPDISVAEPPLELPGFDRRVDGAIARSALAPRVSPVTLNPDTE